MLIESEYVIQKVLFCWKNVEIKRRNVSLRHAKQTEEEPKNDVWIHSFSSLLLTYLYIE